MIGKRIYWIPPQKGSIGNWGPNQTEPLDDDEDCDWCFNAGTIKCTKTKDKATGKELQFCQCRFPWKVSKYYHKSCNTVPGALLF